MNKHFKLCFRVIFLTSAWLMLAPAVPAADKTRSADVIPTEKGPLKIYPINHATVVLQWSDKTIYVDPVGGSKPFQDLPRPDLILITDIHGDHLSKETLAQLAGPQTKLVGPQSVVDQLPSDLRDRAATLANGQTREFLGIQVEAVAAYNLTVE